MTSKRTKIVCTIGPASENKAMLEQLMRSGMNVARLNFSHGSYKSHELIIRNIRLASKRLATPVAIMQDLQGPRIRVGKLSQSGVDLDKGDKVVLIPEKKINYQLLAASTDKVLPIQYEKLAEEVHVGSRILINDGLIQLRVTKIKKNLSLISCRVIQGGLIFSFRGINVPEVEIKAKPITDKDKEDLKFGLKQGIDWVALSFVRNAQDVLNLKKLITAYQPGSQVKVMAKIERKEAIGKMDEIIEVSDGVMVARGDLGIELPPERVPLIQKKIIEKCLAAVKPVIVATQMLESMMINPRPTRAEVSDIANAVIDHTDAVMLSGETATGKFPVEAVNIMASTIMLAEQSPYDNLSEIRDIKYSSATFALADSVNHLVKKLKAKAIVAITHSGHTAKLLARFRPEVKILVMTDNELVQRQLALTWGVEARLVKVSHTINDLILQAIKLAKQEKVGRVGDKIIIATAYPVGTKENLNLIEIAEIR